MNNWFELGLLQTTQLLFMELFITKIISAQYALKILYSKRTFTKIGQQKMSLNSGVVAEASMLFPLNQNVQK